MTTETHTLPIGQQVPLPGHFDVRVKLEAARPLAKGFECRVRMPDGSIEEAVISAEEAAALSGTIAAAEEKPTLATADQLRLLVESARIRLAYAHDRQFAVSLSGIRTLPHQIDAVYIKMLPYGEFPIRELMGTSVLWGHGGRNAHCFGVFRRRMSP